MTLRKRSIAILTAFIAVALLGLVALQYVLMANAIELKEQAFKQNVNAAMNTIVQRLESTEAAGNVFRLAVKDSLSTPGIHMYSFTTDSMLSLSVTGGGFGAHRNVVVSGGLSGEQGRLTVPPPIRWQGQRLWYTVTAPQHVLIRAFNRSTDKDTVIVNADMPAGEHSVDVGNKVFDDGEVVVKFFSDSTTAAIIMQNGSVQTALPDRALLRRREELVGRVVDKMFVGEQVPIEQRLSRSLLDSVIGTSLRESGIDLPFAYGIISERNDSLRMVDPARYAPDLRSSEFKARLFPDDLLFSFNRLALYFPDQRIFLLKQIGPLLVLTVLFMGGIVFCFGYTIRTLIRQKQFLVHLMDFINNMTHEFKTPISTVSVAAETMLHPGVIHDEEKLRRYGSVIQDENLRMKQQVDKILQMAVLEEGSRRLKCHPLDAHEIIAKAADNAALQAEAKGGTVIRHLEATSSVISADAVHFTNIINNLLDNALKYSAERPEITVSTDNAGHRMRIIIADTGIGIPEKDQARVFEKYFRVHTGNVHNVKGFGLGLSYVKLMTEAHGGTISLDSAPGRGTTVTLTFPLL